MKLICENRHDLYLLFKQKEKMKIISVMNFNNILINEMKDSHYKVIYTLNNILEQNAITPFQIKLRKKNIIIHNYLAYNLIYKWNINFKHIELIENINNLIHLTRDKAYANINSIYKNNNKLNIINNFFQNYFKYKQLNILTNNTIKRYYYLLKYCNLDKFIKNIEKSSKTQKKSLSYIYEFTKHKEIKNIKNFIYNKYGCYVIIKNGEIRTCKIGCYNVHLKYIVIYLQSLKEFF